MRPTLALLLLLVFAPALQSQTVSSQGVHLGPHTSAAGTATPACVERYLAETDIRETCRPYTRIAHQGASTIAQATVPLGPSATAVFNDRWTETGGTLTLARTVTVHGNAPGGFLSSLQLTFAHPPPREALDYFIPGVVYGGTAHLTPAAIGGRDTYAASDKGVLQAREDRTPAPLAAIRFPDGSFVSLLHLNPLGATTVEDAQDTQARTLVDRRFTFGALGMHQSGDDLRLGFWYPGSEGEVTYAGNTYPGGQLHRWRRRYHPIEDGLTQQYTLQLQTGTAPTLPDLVRTTWRDAWQKLSPLVTPQNIPLVRDSILNMLFDRVLTVGDRTGIPVVASAVTGITPPNDFNALLGFVGKNIEAANFLIGDAELVHTPKAAFHRQQGEAIIDTFVRQLPVSPPVAEGFNLNTGAPAFNLPHEPEQQRVYLRSLTDDMKSLNRLLLRERAHGREHPAWLAWSRRFADWLLTQQAPDGGFPRSWHPGTGVPFDTSEQASYNPVPFLCLMTSLTGDPTYRHAAERAADFTWAAGQQNGLFVGGTIDNPDIIDKEAGTLSIEAYLTLYEHTHDPKWLAHAQRAAEFAETWIYLWNVPMPIGQPDAALPWKQGVPTVGLQLIATGHSLTDEYMAFDTDEFAELSLATHDRHDLDVSRLLLHDTKVMVALPNRPFDLKGPGWQQEHWSLAPVRGFGLHRLWLPWVSTSQLNGILGLMELDSTLFQQLSAPAADTPAADRSGNPPLP